MGESELSVLHIPHECIYHPRNSISDSFILSDATDTKNACYEMIKQKVQLIIFCGGDGTARDIFSCVGQDVPVLGIPAGVKIYSGVFTTTPESAAQLFSEWDGHSLADGEVMDVDEEEYRKDILNTQLFGYAKIPSGITSCQSCKEVSFSDENRNMQEIASFITEIMRDDTLYLLGAGTTTKAIADHLHIKKTILGIDAVYQNQLVGTDLNESEILRLMDQYERVKIILSPIGAQGFILGRGNQQISKKVLNKGGIDSLIVVATEKKLQRTKNMFIDTGDIVVNHSFGDTIQIICGYRMAIRAKLNK